MMILPHIYDDKECCGTVCDDKINFCDENIMGTLTIMHIDDVCIGMLKIKKGDCLDVGHKKFKKLFSI